MGFGVTKEVSHSKPEGALTNERTEPCALLVSFVRPFADVSCIHDASLGEI